MNDQRINVLFLTGGTNDPATRFRARQFFPHLEERGIDCSFKGAYGPAYNHIFDIPLAGGLYKLASRMRRGGATISATGYDAIVLQRTAFNKTSLPERILARQNPRIVFDIDDAVFLSPEGEPDTRRKKTFCDAVRLSAHVIAGNQYLASHANAPEKTTILQTVIDTDDYTPGEERSAAEVVIGWMGTAGNFPYFAEVLPSIREVLEHHSHVRFRIVSNARLKALEGHPQVEQVTWTESSELTELRGFDIGIMPLQDTPWTRGKCGFKMIQYMSVGCPVVASPVGVNPAILENNKGGFLADDGRQWTEALSTLVADPQRRAAMGQVGRERAEKHYSVRSIIDPLAELIRNVASGPK